MTSNARAQRLIDEFEDGAAFAGGRSVRHGLAAVLRHLCVTEADKQVFGLYELLYAVPQDRLERLADALTAPTLLDRAMAGDQQSARQFLHEAGFTDASGNLLPQFQSPLETND